MNNHILEVVRRIAEMNQQEWNRINNLREVYKRKGWREIVDPSGMYPLVLEKVEYQRVGVYDVRVQARSQWRIEDALDTVPQFSHFGLLVAEITPKATNEEFLDAQFRAAEELVDVFSPADVGTYEVVGVAVGDRRGVTGRASLISFRQDMEDETLEFPIRIVEEGLPHFMSVAGQILKYNQ